MKENDQAERLRERFRDAFFPPRTSVREGKRLNWWKGIITHPYSFVYLLVLIIFPLSLFFILFYI